MKLRQVLFLISIFFTIESYALDCLVNINLFIKQENYTTAKVSLFNHLEPNQAQIISEFKNSYITDYNYLKDSYFMMDQHKLFKRLEILEHLPKTNFILRQKDFKNANDEFVAAKKLLDAYRDWKTELEHEAELTIDEIDTADLSFFIIALIKSRPNYDSDLIYNLSLDVDNIYGLHLYEKMNYPINDLGAFLDIRRHLGLMQISHDVANDLPIALLVNKELKPSDEIILQVQTKITIIKSISEKLTTLIPKLGKIVKRIFELVAPASPVHPIGSLELIKFLERPKTMLQIRKFREQLIIFNNLLELKNLTDKELNTTVLDLALSATDGQMEEAISLIGLVSIQRKAHLWHIGEFYANKGKFFEYASSLHDSVDTYYLITTIAEKVDMRKGISDSNVKRYRFIYLGNDNMTDNKFYHYWSEVYFSYRLNQDGFSPQLIQFALTSVGRAYELATLEMGIGFFRTVGFSLLDSLFATRMLDDIALHREGAKLGSELFLK
jgi:hypothetical protein